MPALVGLQFSRVNIMCPLGQGRSRYDVPEDSDYLFLVILFSEAHGPLARASINGVTSTSLEAKGQSCSLSCVRLHSLPGPHPVHYNKQGWGGE